MEAEAKRFYKILTRQAEGYDRIVKAVGGDAKNAFQLLLIKKYTELAKIWVEAVNNLKVDKITVWDIYNNDD